MGLVLVMTFDRVHFNAFSFPGTSWLMSISLRIRILLIFVPPNPNTLKKLESEYIFFKIEGIRESNYFQTQKSGNTIILKVAKLTNIKASY